MPTRRCGSEVRENDAFDESTGERVCDESVTMESSYKKGGGVNANHNKARGCFDRCSKRVKPQGVTPDQAEEESVDGCR